MSETPPSAPRAFHLLLGLGLALAAGTLDLVLGQSLGWSSIELAGVFIGLGIAASAWLLENGPTRRPVQSRVCPTRCESPAMSTSLCCAS